MKTRQFLLIVLGAAAAGLTGCGKPDAQSTATPPEKGTVQTAVEGFTGKTAVDAGLRAKEQIKKANEKEMQDRTDAMQ